MHDTWLYSWFYSRLPRTRGSCKQLRGPRASRSVPRKPSASLPRAATWRGRAPAGRQPRRPWARSGDCHPKYPSPDLPRLVRLTRGLRPRVLLALGGAGAGWAGPKSRGQRRRRSVPTATARVPPASHAGCGRESPAPLPCFAPQPLKEGKGGCSALSRAVSGAFRQEENTRLGFWGQEGSRCANHVLMFLWPSFRLVFVTALSSRPLVPPAAQDVVAAPSNETWRQESVGEAQTLPPGCHDQATSCVHRGAGMERAGAAEKLLQSGKVLPFLILFYYFFFPSKITASLFRPAAAPLVLCIAPISWCRGCLVLGSLGASPPEKKEVAASCHVSAGNSADRNRYSRAAHLTSLILGPSFHFLPLRAASIAGSGGSLGREAPAPAPNLIHRGN